MKKLGVRIIALILVAIMVSGIILSVLAMFAGAAGEPQPGVVTGDVSLSGNSSMVLGKASSTRFTVYFNFRVADAANVRLERVGGSYAPMDSLAATGEKFAFTIPGDSAFFFETNSELTIKPPTTASGIYTASLTLITYNGEPSRTLYLYVNARYNNTDYVFEFSIPIGSRYIRGSSSSSEPEDEEIITSDIVVESVTLKDGAGKVLTEVDKDTPPFTVEIVYSDLGLAEVGRFRLEAADIQAFIINSSGFKTPEGMRGSAALISGAPKYPRFRATFKNVQTDESSRALSFRLMYDIEGRESGVSGESTAILHQITTPEDAKETAPLKPNLILREYSYGAEPIVAGADFDLNMVVANTSRDIEVKNVVMTIEPANGFVIAAASNTVFFQDMPAESSMPHSVKLHTMPQTNSSTSGVTTEYSVTIKFSYQYMSNKEYAPGETAVKIAIPVSQLDRFEVGSITEYSSYLMVGEEGFVSVPITNKGKSPTYNISGVITGGDMEIIAPSEYFGNLEAGKTDTVNLSFTVSVPGEFTGEAVITYEDENRKENRIAVSFTSMINEPAPPPGVMPPGMMPEFPEQESGLSLYTILMCAAGAVFMSTPLTLYMIKRVKAKGDEDIDEDF